MLTFLVAAQIAAAVPPPVDSTYASAALREMVARIAEANRRVPEALRSYSSRIETESSLLLRDTLGREQTASVEQFATAATWDRGGRYNLHIIGYRSQSVGVPYSTLTIVRAWTVPSLYGDRLSLGAYFARRTQGDTLIAVHPFAADRDRFYRFSGGDTITTLNIGTRRIPIVRIRAKPVASALRSLGAFDGEIDVDAQRWQIVRMRGRFVVAATPTKRETLARALGVEGVVYAEFVNAEVDGKYWLPAFQRTEFQASIPLLGQTRPVFRLVSTISGIVVNDTGAVADDSRVAPQVTVSWASSDSVSAFGDWAKGFGVQTAGVHADDFQDLAPDIWRTDGPPRVGLFPNTTSRILRFNRVEGLYTGLAPTVDFRSAVPGVSAGAWAGWAWTEQTVRGGGFVSRRDGQTTLVARADRALVSTNDFGIPLEDDVGIAALLGSVDDYDYVDRRSAMLSMTRVLGSVEQGVATIQLGGGHDSPETARLSHGLLSSGLSFRANRGSAAGSYAHAAADLELHPDVSGDYVQPGVGLLAHYEVGSGDLNWQRAELRLSARQYVGPIALAAHVDGGVVLGGMPPPQTLFELGGNQALPGYSYKQFVGDRAALFRSFASYRFPLWQRPLHVWRNLLIPGISPGLAISAQGGWTELSSAGAVASARQLVAGTTAIAEPSHGVRATLGAGVTFFSDLLHLGVARPVDRPSPWRFVAGFGQTF